MDISINPAVAPHPVIALANWFQFGPSERIHNPCVESRMLLWVVSGCGRVRINGQWLALEPDDFVFLPWGRDMLYEASPEQPFHVGGIHLVPHHDPTREIEFAVSHGPNDPLARASWRSDWPWVQLEGVQKGSLVHAPALRLLAHYTVERFIGRLPLDPAMRGLAHLLIGEISSALEQQQSHSINPPEPLQQLIDYIHTHLEQPLTVPELARVAGCSTATVHRLFTRALAISPSRFVTNARISEAKRLLRGSRRPIHQISILVGITDPFHFSKLFKRVVGVSPQTFRRQTRLL